MSGGKRCGVIQPVTHHQHPPALFGHATHQIDFLVRQDTGMYLINPKLCGKGGGTGRCVSGDHRDLPPAGAKRGDQRGGAGARGLGQRQGMHRSGR